MKAKFIIFAIILSTILISCGSHETAAASKKDINQGFELHMSDARDSNLELNIDDCYIMTVNEVGVRGIPSMEAEINRTLSYQMVDVDAVVYGENNEKWALINFFNFDSADDNIGWVKISELMEYTEENYSLLRYPVKVTENCVDLETGEKVEWDWVAVDYCDGYAEVWREGGQSCKIDASCIIYPPFRKDNKKVSDFVKLREDVWVAATMKE